MFGTYFYHQTSRKMVVAFGTLFNTIEVRRTNSSDEVTEVVKIPLSYGPKDKMLARFTSDPNLSSSVALTVPRMGFELTSIAYDSSRKLTKKNRMRKVDANNPLQMQYQYAPAPYNLGFTLSVMVKNTDDGLQIIEQIMPYFTPDYTVTINTVPDMGDKRDIPIILDNMSQEDTYEGD